MITKGKFSALTSLLDLMYCVTGVVSGETEGYRQSLQPVVLACQMREVLLLDPTCRGRTVACGTLIVWLSFFFSFLLDKG